MDKVSDAEQKITTDTNDEVSSNSLPQSQALQDTQQSENTAASNTERSNDANQPELSSQEMEQVDESSKIEDPNPERSTATNQERTSQDMETADNSLNTADEVNEESDMAESQASTQVVWVGQAKPKWVPNVDLDALRDVESPDQDLSEYAIKFIEDLNNSSVNNGKLFISKMHGLLFEGSQQLQIPFQNVRWISKQGSMSDKTQRLSFSILLSYEDAEMREILYIFFECEQLTKEALDRINFLKVEELKAIVPSCSNEDEEKMFQLLSEQPTDIAVILMKVKSKHPTMFNGDEQQKEYVMVFDLECISFFEGSTYTPVYQIKFWSDPGPNVVETVKIVHSENEVLLETDLYTFALVKTRQIEEHLKNMAARKKNFFTDGINLVTNATQLKTRTQNPKRRFEAAGSSRDWEEFQPRSLKIEEEMNDAVDSLGSYEDFQVQWIALEADLEEIFVTGTVQESEIQSGGLDPNNEEHLEKALADVVDQLKEQRLDMAISRLQAARKLFMASHKIAFKNLFRSSDLELMKKLYFRSLLQ